MYYKMNALLRLFRQVSERPANIESPMPSRFQATIVAVTKSVLAQPTTPWPAASQSERQKKRFHPTGTQHSR